jgi:hypothetical protein
MNTDEKFVQSTLKVVASAEVDVSKDLETETPATKTVADLLEENDEKNKE